MVITMNKHKSVKLSLILTNIFILLLIIATVALPWMVYWYVETMKRSATLPATIMVTCYPCAPFVAAALITLRKILKNVLKDKIFVKDNTYRLKVMSICCIIVALITLIAGRFYLPFYIVGGTFAFLALLLFAISSIFGCAFELTDHEVTEEENSSETQTETEAEVISENKEETSEETK